MRRGRRPTDPPPPTTGRPTRPPGTRRHWRTTRNKRTHSRTVATRRARLQRPSAAAATARAAARSNWSAREGEASPRRSRGRERAHSNVRERAPGGDNAGIVRQRATFVDFAGGLGYRRPTVTRFYWF